MLSILQHTPLWAFLLLGILIMRGLSARFDQVIPVRRAMTMPLLMLVWSMSRLLVEPQQAWVTLPAWFFAAATSFACSRMQGWPRGLLLDPPSEFLYVPGSWLTLFLMLLMYAAHFMSEVFRAMHPDIAALPVFTAGFSLVYGAVSGIFLARSVAIWQLIASRYLARS